MAGMLTHFAVAFASFILVFFIFYKSRFRIYYAGAIFLGNIITDALGFGYYGIKLWTLNPRNIMVVPAFLRMARFIHTFSNWIIFAFIIVVIVLILYLCKKISAKTLYAWMIGLICFLVGISIHLFLDVRIHERSPWI
jgi:hypothetical protein